jgi:hypothetical protein
MSKSPLNIDSEITQFQVKLYLESFRTQKHQLELLLAAVKKFVNLFMQFVELERPFFDELHKNLLKGRSDVVILRRPPSWATERRVETPLGSMAVSRGREPGINPERLLPNTYNLNDEKQVSKIFEVAEFYIQHHYVFDYMNDHSQYHKAFLQLSQIYRYIDDMVLITLLFDYIENPSNSYRIKEEHRIYFADEPTANIIQKIRKRITELDGKIAQIF